jgi:hypothetical protein
MDLTSAAADTATPAGPPDTAPRAVAADAAGLDATALAPASRASWIGWRLRLLVAAALLGCVGLYALSGAVAALPHLDAGWRSDVAGRVLLARSQDPVLEPLRGRALTGIVGAGDAVPLTDAIVLQRSARWIPDDAERARYIGLHAQLAAAMAQPAVRLLFADGASAAIRPARIGYVGLGPTYWMLCAAALLLYLVAMVALLARPRALSLLYALMAWCQIGNLLFMAVESALELNLPPGFALWDAHARVAFDLVTGAAAVHAVALHPTRLPAARAVALCTWCGVAALLALSLGGSLPDAWWNTQLATVGCGALALTLLTVS